MSSAEQHARIAAVAPMAIAGRRHHGIPASVTIAQAILESAGRTIAPVDFRQRGGARASLMRSAPLPAYSRLNRRARSAANDALKFALRLKRSGYSTDPQYGRKLAALIKAFALFRYDQPAAQGGVQCCSWQKS